MWNIARFQEELRMQMEDLEERNYRRVGWLAWSRRSRGKRDIAIVAVKQVSSCKPRLSGWPSESRLVRNWEKHEPRPPEFD
ncbi:unnamed protein product [Urochloa humidicola]